MLACDDFLNFGLNCDNFLDNSWYFLDDFLNVGDDFLYFFDSFINYNFLNNLLNVLDFDFILFGLYDFFDKLWYLDDFFENFPNRNNFLDYNFDRYSDLSGNDDDLLDLNGFDLLVVLGYNFIDIESLRDFINDLNCIFDFDLMGDYFLFFIGDGDEFVDHSVDGFLNFNVNVFDGFYLDNSLLNDRNLDYALDFLDNYFLSLNVHNNLDDFWYFNELLYNPWDNNDLLYNFLYFNYFWHFNQLLKDFVDMYSNFLYSFDVSWNLYDSFLNVLDGLGYLNVVVDNLFNFDKLWLVDDHWFT